MTPLQKRPAAKSALVDMHGRPMATNLYATPRNNTRSYKPRKWLSPDSRSNISQYDREELVNYSRQLFAQVDALSAAVNQKNHWAFGDAWEYHYTGANRAWGEEAQNFINEQFFPNCNVRGPQYDMKRSMLLSGISWDVDGDDAMVLTKTDQGFPQLAFYPATKIGSGPIVSRSTQMKGSANTVSGGMFDGASIFDGVICDRNARPIGLRIANENGTFEDISTYNVDLAYEPQWADQGRGFPKVATGLLRWMDLQDVDDFIRKGVKRASAIGLIQKNEEGEAPVGNEILTGDDNYDTARNTIDGSQVGDRKVAYEEIEGGETYYLSAPGGESIEALKFENPHPNVEAFIERVLRGCLASVGWYIELLNIGGTSRAPTRVLCDLANQSIWARQQTGVRRWRRAVGYALAVGMKNGYLSRNDSGHDAYLMEPGLPRPITVDSGNEAAADREGLKLGLTNRAILAQKNHGAHYRAIDAQRARELRETIEAAESISRDHPKITFDRALELLEQRSPNPIAQAPKTAEPKSQKNNPPTQ